MKTFIPNNKWVMTATLLAVLGLNLSYNDKTSREGFADFASETKEGQIIMSNGEVNTPRYIKGEGDKVTAYVKIGTEGGFCSTGECKIEEITITSKNFGDIKKLDMDLVKHIKDNLSEIPKAKEKDQEVAVEEEESEEKIGNAILDAQVLEKCEKKRSDSDMLSCLSDKFVSVLKKNAKKISDEEAMDFYKEHIEGLIESQVSESREAMKQRTRTYLGETGTSLYDFDPADEDYEDKDPKELLDAATDAIRKLHEGIPSIREGKDRTRRFADLRKELINTEKSLVAQHARDVKKALATAEANKNSGNYGSYLAEFDVLNRSLPSMISSLSSTTREALRDAVSNEYIRNNEAKAQLDSFLLSSGNMQNDLNKFTNDWAVSGRLNGVGLDTYLSDADLNARLNGTANRGGSYTPTGIAISSRTGNVLSQSSTDLQLQATNNGVEFGQLVPLTQENIALRDQLRTRIMLQRGQ